MFGLSFQIARAWGIPIKVHITLILLLPFLAWEFGVLAAVVLAVGLFGGIVLHELGHSLAAVRKGCRVHEILLLPFGGVARMENLPVRPADEILVAVAGPAVSLALFGVLFHAGHWVPIGIIRLGPDVSLTLVQLIGVANGVLGIFNLLPSFPMDGGRVLRAMLTPRLGRLVATRIATRTGRTMAVLFGVYALFDLPDRLLTLLAAVFLFYAAGAEYRRVFFEEMLKRRSPWSRGFEPDPAGRVHVGPPPYADGRGSEADIRRVPPRLPLG
jgi:Zn-dependent protease